MPGCRMKSSRRLLNRSATAQPDLCLFLFDFFCAAGGDAFGFMSIVNVFSRASASRGVPRSSSIGLLYLLALKVVRVWPPTILTKLFHLLFRSALDALT